MVTKDGNNYPLLSNGVSLFASDPDVLTEWPSKNNKNSSMSVVKSKIPTLLISGEWGSYYTTFDAEKAAESLKNSTHVVFPYDGHCPINACFFQMAKSFLDDPMNTFDTSCAQAPNPIAFD